MSRTGTLYVKCQIVVCLKCQTVCLILQATTVLQTTQFYHCSWKAAKYVNKHDRIPVKPYLQTIQFKFYIFSCATKYYFFDFFNHLENVKTTLSSSDVKKRRQVVVCQPLLFKLTRQNCRLSFPILKID